MKRVVVIGSGGAGKSTFSRRLGDILQIKVYHLDALFWKPGWVGVPKEEQKIIQQNLVDQDEWIIDGNYGGTMDIRLNQADTILFLDISRVICIYRVLKRNFQYWNKTRPDMGEGCEEKVDLEFLKWVWRYPKDKKPAILDKLNSLSTEQEVVILSSRTEVAQFLKRLEGEKQHENKIVSS